jgi:hypothetical protein
MELAELEGADIEWNPSALDGGGRAINGRKVERKT